jgi:hypothetical protein
MQSKSNLSLSKKLVKPLLISGLFLSGGFAYANEAEVKLSENTQQSASSVEDLEQQEKIQARLNEIAAEAKAAKLAQSGYYVERKSYGTGRETDPPRYVKQLNKTWLKDVAGLEDVDWLDIGLDYRFRYETRDNDFRRGRDTIDEPILLRTRGYLAVKDILDPLRFTLEVEDARRNHSQFPREFDTRDVNYAEPIQAYLELFLKRRH